MEINNNLGIIGHGVVGKAIESVFKNKFKIFVYDKYVEEYKDLKVVIFNCNIIFVSVPTPMKESGEVDLEYIKDALEMIEKERKIQNKKLLIVLRSTITPGTTDALQKEYPNLRLMFNPEFLTERKYLEDMKETNNVVLGGSNGDMKIVEQIYKKVFPEAKYILTNPRTAEMIKYSANATLAGQVIIANELFNICKKINVDWKIVRDAIVFDPLIGRNNNVPGPDGDFGFGGKCLPKDLNALIYTAKLNGYNPEFLEQIWKSNLKFRKNKNWLDIKGATSENRFKTI